ncbi:MAG: hypothetical protein ACOVNV_02685, partial [Pirellulaceae bacterium]
DPVMVSSVNEVETLTTDLSRKIWQKIMILHSSHQGSSLPIESATNTPTPPAVAPSPATPHQA